MRDSIYQLLLNLAISYGTMNREVFTEKVEELASKYNLDPNQLDGIIDLVLNQLQNMRFRQDMKMAFSAAVKPESDSLHTQLDELSRTVSLLSEQIRELTAEIKELKGGKSA